MFYYLLAGANEVEAQEYHLSKPEEYFYLNKVCRNLICSAIFSNYMFLQDSWSVIALGWFISCLVGPDTVMFHSVFQTGCFDLDGVDEAYEFLRLKQSMDMVGFSSDTQRK